MKTVIAIILLQVCLYLPLQAQSFGYTITGVNDTSMTFVPMLDIMMTNDTAWLAYTIYETVSEDSIYVSEQFLYTDMTWSTPVTVFGLTPSTNYSIYLEMWGTNWNFMDGVYGATPGSFTTTGPVVLEHQELQELIIYPNPSNGIFTIKGADTDVLLVITDVFGKAIIKKSLGDGKISLENVPSGTYFITVGNIRKKIIVQP